VVPYGDVVVVRPEWIDNAGGQRQGLLEGPGNPTTGAVGRSELEMVSGEAGVKKAKGVEGSFEDAQGNGGQGPAEAKETGPFAKKTARGETQRSAAGFCSLGASEKSRRKALAQTAGRRPTRAVRRAGAGPHGFALGLSVGFSSRPPLSDVGSRACRLTLCLNPTPLLLVSSLGFW